MADDFRQRLAAALAATCKLHEINGGCIACDRRLAAIMAVRDEARESMRATVAHYENTITWGTTCHGCARILDSSIRETERAEKAEAEAADQRERAEMAEHAIITAIAGIKTINLAGECPPDPSEWQRGYWACVHKVIGTMQAQYVDAALDAMRKTKERVRDELRKMMGDDL